MKKSANVKKRRGRPPIPVLDLNDLTQQQIADLWRVTKQAVCQWGDAGGSRKTNGRYSGPDVVAWREAKLTADNPGVERSGLELEKLRLQIERMQLDLDKIKANTIELDAVKTWASEQAGDLKTYLFEFGKLNLHQIAHKPVEAIREWWTDLIRKGLKHYVDGKRRLDTAAREA